MSAPRIYSAVKRYVEFILCEEYLKQHEYRKRQWTNTIFDLCPGPAVVNKNAKVVVSDYFFFLLTAGPTLFRM